ncbi:hypothetical protein SETIT_4G109200v2 [Setaria italica]|uniref:Protein kinase domain-containing protein n=1 Tax=Setaria italica TaxID=4555 RepID=A0A368QTD3_SETIT|nr:uncharacterized protein LOC101765952 isoform X1 [Setaria italica]XP_004965133.1 uncharacterized protein LOC101765952 isoform X1 [Setaria italica]RCV21082.1 hypothetical protein SETIT_4G109200v2 [Setaria italica]RCV21083.1 hypothetical protein SETIT_4G109200v2 [Setaria italica]RCV21084.1 hypothetical protein SETIT_4G109200v2 [Setaria italica]RCV21085.1 hypothetical protein SETIT_4G109200v2 [Setaria italica]
MYSGASTFDDYRKQLQIVLQDPSEEPVPLSLDYLKAITDGFSSDRLVGRGGFGEVYRGVIGREKFIAIKKLYAEHVVDDSKYKAEFNSLMRIRHPNIVQLIGYCAETKFEAMPQNGEHILAERRHRLLCFEYISNGSLRDYVLDLDLGWDKRYAIMEGICKGLDFLHEECNLTHMDLKPENILIDDDMVPKITDFGLSRLRDAQKSQILTHTLTGTLGYMPPEYLLEGKISHKTDIYSLGVIMCEIITGEKVPIGWSMEFTERACGRWMKIFEKSLNDASLKEIYIKQVKQLLDIALKCVDHDRTKRPGSSEILNAFYPNPAGRSLCESNSNYGQVIELLSVHPLQLDFSLPEPKKLHRSSCSLHLTNNIDVPVVFTLLPSERLSAHFLSQSGVVPPKCRYTLAVVMHHQQNPRFGNDDFFTLESTKERYQGLRIVGPGALITKARERGLKVYEVKIAAVCAHTDPPIRPNLKPELARRVSWDRQDVKPELKIMPARYHDYWSAQVMCVHPTESWILWPTLSRLLEVWDYDRMEKVHFCFAQPQRVDWIPSEEADDIYGDADGQLSLPTGIPKLVSRKRWILVGSSTQYSRRDVGYIYVYSYMAVKNFKGSKTYILSKIKSFKAHERGSVLLEVHPSRPYVLSSLAHANLPHGNARVVCSIKLWDWERGWDCVQTFNTEDFPRQLKFNPNDQDTFVTFFETKGAEVWDIDSPKCKSKLPGTSAVSCLDFFIQGGKQYLIIVRRNQDKFTIWDYDTGTLVETLKEKNISTACSHPELPVLITGSMNGRVSLWSSSTFNLVGVLNCDLGTVYNVFGVKGSERIIIGHAHGIAVVEIGHMLESERPHESEGSEI